MCNRFIRFEKELIMPFKKVETGIYSYYKKSDDTKKHQSYYFSTTNTDGRTIKLKSKHTDIRQVRKERAGCDLRVEADNAISINRNSTLNEVAKSYISVKTGKPMPKLEYQKYLKHCEHGIGKKKIKSITATDVAQFKANLESNGLKPRPRMIQLKALLNAGGSTVKVKIDKVNASIKKRYFTQDELDIIFDMAQRIHPELHFFTKMLLYTGQRPKNVLEVKVDDIHLDRSVIDFGEIKGQEEAEIPISKKLRPLLEKWIQDREGNLFQLSQDYLQELSQEIFDVFNKPLYKKDGMSAEEEKQARKEAYKTKRHRWASFYGLRHTTAVNIIKNTGSVYKAQQMLRHSDIKMTMIYAQDEDAQGTADAI
ncbi:Site-specific recombinase XerD [Epsilonproteobacteria bacterium SCGC AD-308-E02]|mgnify:CR=1 FL=1|jgi:integrase|nr:Site-specific recombinase XerD [Epsilonproteobacteria bacterium SCGC AD-308-E02]